MSLELVDEPHTPRLKKTGDRLDKQAQLERRLSRAVNVAVKGLSSDGILSALGEPTDFESLLATLTKSNSLPNAPDSHEAARLRGVQAVHQLLEKKSTLSATEAAELLSITPQAIYQRRRNSTLLAVPTAHGLAFPSWQFGPGGVLPRLKEVLKTLDDNLGPWMVLAFFVNKNTSLPHERTPAEALQHGEVDSVLRAARLYGHHGAV